MAQKSYPWGRALGADSMAGYTAKEWYSIWGAIARTGQVTIDGGITGDAAFYNQGVFYSIGNRLVCTTPANARVDVDTGAALVEGAFFENDTAIGAAGDISVGPRTCYVVVRKNYSAVAYSPAGIASVALFTVPAYTARVTVIDNGSFTQDVNRLTYWDIPLASFDIDAGGVITNFTDLRDWADAETAYLWLAPTIGYNNTDTAEIPISHNTAMAPNPFPQIVLTDNKDCLVTQLFAIPAGYISGSIQGVCQGNAGAANIFCGMYLIAGGACSENIGTHFVYGVSAAEAMQNGIALFSCHAFLAIPAALVVGDMVSTTFRRDATDPLDTVGGPVNFWGFLVTYLKWRT